MLYEETCIDLDLPLCEVASVEEVEQRIADVDKEIAEAKAKRDAADPAHKAGHDTIITHMVGRKNSLESLLRTVKRFHSK